MGYGPQDKTAFRDTSKFETTLDLKIVIFLRSCSGKLEVYKNTNETHQNTVHLYLHDDYYYMIQILKAFLGYSYVCEYCYQGFKDHSLHYCKFTCNVCNTPQCYEHPNKWVQCEDCARYCRSDFCCEMHKRPQSDELRSRCDLVKYCDRCCRQYREKRTGDKLLSHTFALSKCPHCSDVLIDEGLHSCYIQPLKPGEHSKKIFILILRRCMKMENILQIMCVPFHKMVRSLQPIGLIV